MINILLLGPTGRNQLIKEAIQNLGICINLIDNLAGFHEEKISKYTHLISSGYHKRIPSSILHNFKKSNRLNIHASLLPFGKGIGTALFAVLYPVPLGSTVHVLDDKIDCGDVIIQSRFEIPSYIVTQRMLYSFWIDHATQLFLANLKPLLEGVIDPLVQPKGFRAPYLSRNESEFHLSLLSNGWDTTLEDLNYLSLIIAMRTAAVTFSKTDEPL